MQVTTTWTQAILITISGAMLSFGVGTLVTISGAMLSFGAGTASALAASGAWPSGSLNRCHLGSYASNCSSAASVWSLNTDLTLGYSCASLNLQTLGYNYGNTGWTGIAYVCNGPLESDCGSTTADLVGSFTYAEARNNEFSLATYTNAERQKTCTHELGHVWGLLHDGSATSVMKQGKASTITLNATNVSDVNAKY